MQISSFHPISRCPLSSNPTSPTFTSSFLADTKLHPNTCKIYILELFFFCFDPNSAFCPQAQQQRQNTRFSHALAPCLTQNPNAHLDPRLPMSTSNIQPAAAAAPPPPPTTTAATKATTAVLRLELQQPREAGGGGREGLMQYRATGRHGPKTRLGRVRWVRCAHHWRVQRVGQRRGWVYLKLR